MNTSTSEYSSGCESGWTMYLDPYSRSLDTNHDVKGGYVSEVEEEEEEEEEEDLSMVSDASSGPPYYGYAAPVYEDKKESKNKNKSKPRKETKQQMSLCLDDTASSSIFHFSHEDNVPRTNDDRNSAGHVYFEDESRTKKRLSFFKSSKSGSLLGRKRQ